MSPSNTIAGMLLLNISNQYDSSFILYNLLKYVVNGWSVVRLPSFYLRRQVGPHTARPQSAPPPAPNPAAIVLPSLLASRILLPGPRRHRLSIPAAPPAFCSMVAHPISTAELNPQEIA